MAKSKLRLRARELRQKGESIIVIAKNLGISKGTVSLWCRDMVLSEEQIVRLLNNKSVGLKKAQLKGALVQKTKRLAKIEKYIREGYRKFEKFTPDQFFVGGLALYLAEGRKNQRVVFTNSNPRIIKFMLQWFRTFFKIYSDQLTFYVHINEIHKHREATVVDYWSNYLEVPLSRFKRVIFIKSIQKKVYENHNTHYGTLHCEVLKSKDLLYKINGLLEGLLQHRMLV
jgi:transcriptional regulator with XRE-family HTH domain